MKEGSSGPRLLLLPRSCSSSACCSGCSAQRWTQLQQQSQLPLPPNHALRRNPGILETVEYIERYGDKPIWFGYRGKKIAENPCPICRDQKLHVDYRNVKLLEQFICSHTGVIFHPTRTDVCMKQHKCLTQAIDQARDHGLLSFHIPLVMLQGKDYTNQHQAVTKTHPPPPCRQPPEKDIARICRIYKDYRRRIPGRHERPGQNWMECPGVWGWAAPGGAQAFGLT
uniref:Small ribosomal subunit protein mS40 n=1 Tax=Gopherus evgoodei TaxID=1825980 RepID=A0A8C4VGX1_9SAUR